MPTTALRLTSASRSAEAVRPSGFAAADAARIGGLAADALRAELDTWPKPGLVSPRDSGSHDDMDHGTFLASIAAIHPFYVALAAAGAAGAGMDELRRVGVRAEAAMLAATSGVNTHRGAIFALGLLCAAAGTRRAEAVGQGRAAAAMSADDVARLAGSRWGAEILRGPILLNSHGTAVMRRYGAGGARAEAAAGFPQARTIGLPALREGRATAGDEAAARVHAFFALLATTDDTNLLHRGGETGLRDAQAAAGAFLAAGGVGRADWQARAAAVHHDFVARRLSPGGCADLLAVTIFLDRLEAAP